MDDTGNFEVSSVRDALADVTNDQNNRNTEAAAIARERGWVAPEALDYDKYKFAPAEKLAEGDESLQEEPVPEWAANAAKYEWNDEYGDVGPKNPRLEEQLFRSEFINRTGLKIGK